MTKRYGNTAGSWLFLAILISSSGAFAQLTVTGVENPPSYNTFLPPAAGGSYSDPVFGSTVKRLTNALATANADGGGNLTYITGEYSTMTPFSSDNSKLLLINGSYFALYDGTGAFIKNLPMEINASSEPRWSRANNTTIYYHSGNQLKTYDTATGAINVVRTFSEYSSISGMGESDISADGDHFVFAGDNRYIFVYQLSTNTKFPAFDTGGRSFDSIYITPNNNVIISWLTSGTARYTGMELFDINMNFLRQIAHADGHKDVTRDTDGEEVLVWTNSNDAQPIPNCNNGIVKIRLSDASQTCLLQLDWSLAPHISAPDQAGFIYIETYAPANPSPGTSSWVPYTNELLQIKLDGSQVVRLAHHRSRPWNGYNWQPKVSTSRDGSRIIFNSNYDLQGILGYPSEYSDVYMIVVGSSAPVSSPSPAPSPTPTPPPTPSPSPTPTPTTTSTITRYEQDNAAVRYTGTWYPNTGSFNSGGSATLSMTRGSQAIFTFTGTAVNWIGYRDEWSGLADVYVDGTYANTIDTYASPAQAQTVIYSVTGLTAGVHTLTINVRGKHSKSSSGSWVWVDAFDVTNAVTTSSTSSSTSSSGTASSSSSTPASSSTSTSSGSTPSTTSSTPVRIEQDNPAVVYTGGTWYPKSYSWASGGTILMCMDANAKATLTFSGTGVSWIGYKDEWSGIANVYVDGVLKATIDTYASPAQAQATQYSISNLPAATHTLTIQVTGTQNSASGGSWIWVDAFVVTP